MASSSESVSNPWRIAGAYLDSATGLYKIGARYYDPSVGRWTRWDPVLFALDPWWNPYAFVGDAPVNFMDPAGLDDVGAWGVDYSRSDYFDWAGSCDCWPAGFVGDWPGDGGGGGNAGYAEIGWQAGSPSATDIVAAAAAGWTDGSAMVGALAPAIIADPATLLEIFVTGYLIGVTGYVVTGRDPMGGP